MCVCVCVCVCCLFVGVFFVLINLFIYLLNFWLRWVFIAAHRLFSTCGERGATLHCSVQASHCGGFSRCRARALGAWASVVVARGTRAQQLWLMGSRAQAQ